MSYISTLLISILYVIVTTRLTAHPFKNKRLNSFLTLDSTSIILTYFLIVMSISSIVVGLNERLFLLEFERPINYYVDEVSLNMSIFALIFSLNNLYVRKLKTNIKNIK